MRKRLTMMLCLALMCSYPALAQPYILQGDDFALLVDARGQSILEGDGIDAIFEVREDALYAAGRVGDYRLYDAAGNPVGGESFGMIDDQGDRLIFQRDGLFGAMDELGNVLVDPVWSQLTFNGTGGYLATTGDVSDEVPDPVFYLSPEGVAMDTGLKTLFYLDRFSGGLMVYVNEMGRYGCLNAAGEVAIPCQYGWIGRFVEGCALAALEGAYGLMDTAGAWVVEPRYAWMARGEGLIAALCEDEGLVVFDNGGQRLWSRAVEARQAAIVGAYVALWEGDAARVYDAWGRQVCEVSPEALLLAGVDGQIIASEGNGSGEGQYLIDPDGTAHPERYQRLTPLCPGRYGWLLMQGVEYYSEELNRVQTSWDYESARVGLTDGAGMSLLPAEYLDITAVGEDRLVLRREDQLIFADVNGRGIRVFPVGSR